MAGTGSTTRGTAARLYAAGWVVTVAVWAAAVPLALYGHAFAAVVLVAVWWYPFACWRRPFRRCYCCRESPGRHYKTRDGKKVGTTFKQCRWCSGSGGRLRYGRRIYNHFQRVKKKAGA